MQNVLILNIDDVDNDSDENEIKMHRTSNKNWKGAFLVKFYYCSCSECIWYLQEHLHSARVQTTTAVVSDASTAAWALTMFYYIRGIIHLPHCLTRRNWYKVTWLSWVMCSSAKERYLWNSLEVHTLHEICYEIEQKKKYI
jgi:hypothetical protein